MTKAKLRPITFSDAMVRAILDGRKTQTRRVVSFANCDTARWCWDRLELDDAKLPAKVHPTWADNGYLHVPTKPHPEDRQDADFWTYTRVRPTWSVGDVLWVKEAWAERGDIDRNENPEKARHYVRYGADGNFDPLDNMNWHDYGRKWKSSRFMPFVYARLFLRITEIRVQRVQEISDQPGWADVRAEGIECPAHGPAQRPCTGYCRSLCEKFAETWDALNARRGYSWESNPWVWALTFERCDEPKGASDA